MLDGLMYGCGDAVIGINPASDNLPAIIAMLQLVDDFRTLRGADQSCVLTHVTNSLRAIDGGAPVDLVFQSIGGSGRPTRASVSTWPCCARRTTRRPLGRGTAGENLMYFETGQGSALSANATVASISRPSRRGHMPWRALSSRCWSIPWSVHRPRIPL